MRQPHAPSASAGNVKYILHENPPRGEFERNACESKSGEFFGVQYPEAGRKFIPEDFVERRIVRLRNAQGMGLNYLTQRYGGCGCGQKELVVIHLWIGHILFHGRESGKFLDGWLKYFLVFKKTIF
ncbi:hypothetical protein AVEN_193437-1 [Araneus ventricosus]|uniref:Uncharacterized protein n=1 Tax=Araneus ventricosus TaxID=182803 RepID=A0A4Y2G5T7_ARAVE|nr:hypothetical protein AVEN_193437-1 [Araneus ventricosus]